MKKLYILLTRSNTVPAKVIHLLTGDLYTHSSIATDAELRTLTSFARKYEYFPLPAGLVYEDIEAGYIAKHMNMHCLLYSLEVSDEVFEKATRMINEMVKNRDDYAYSIAGLAFCRMGISHKTEGRYFCSQYVSTILQESGALDMGKDPSLTRPVDFFKHPALKKVYAGRIKGLIQSQRFASIR